MRTCEWCGKELIIDSPYIWMKRFCSSECKKIAKLHENDIPVVDAHEEYVRVCKGCGKTFTTRRYIQRYCIPQCRQKLFKKPPEIKQCIVCGSNFSTSVNAKCCSDKCRAKRKFGQRKPRACPACSKTFIPEPGQTTIGCCEECNCVIAISTDLMYMLKGRSALVVRTPKVIHMPKVVTSTPSVPKKKVSEKLDLRKTIVCKHRTKIVHTPPPAPDPGLFFDLYRECYLKEAKAMLEGKHWEGKNKCIKLKGDSIYAP